MVRTFMGYSKAFSVFLLIIVIKMSCSCGTLAKHDVWLIDTHQASWHRASEESFKHFVYYQLIDNKWVKSDAETFYATQSPELPLVVFSPGYTSTIPNTVNVGMTLVRLYKPEQECRTVFWCWPSESIRHRLAPDIRKKISVAVASSDYLTMFLRRLKAESKVCMIGFSFGNRIICDTVEQMHDDQPEGMQIHLVLIAAANDQTWFANDSRHGNVPKTAKKILILYNPADAALRFYPFLYGNGLRPNALGRFGPPTSLILPEFHDRIEAINVKAYVGKIHRTVYHLYTPVFRKRMNAYLFFGETENP